MIKAILFDLDGVLIDSEYRTISIKKRLLEEYGFTVDDQLIQKLAGKKLNNILPQLFPDFDKTEQLLLQYQHRAYDNIDYSLLEMPKATSVLKQLHKKYRLALVTASDKEKLKQVFAQLHWENIFDVVVDADSKLPAKPNPEVYLQAMQLLKVKSDECVVVEDSTNGLMAAKAAMVKVIAKREQRYNIDQSLADEYIDNLEELLEEDF
ncbi:MAG: HAD family phosphatase [Erysipelotrichia bacterium]|nr:HAD family phosphatase [Erysipelotrichia bacterium]